MYKEDNGAKKGQLPAPSPRYERRRTQANHTGGVGYAGLISLVRRCGQASSRQPTSVQSARTVKQEEGQERCQGNQARCKRDHYRERQLDRGEEQYV